MNAQKKALPDERWPKLESKTEKKNAKSSTVFQTFQSPSFKGNPEQLRKMAQPESVSWSSNPTSLNQAPYNSACAQMF